MVERLLAMDLRRRRRRRHDRPLREWSAENTPTLHTPFFEGGNEPDPVLERVFEQPRLRARAGVRLPRSRFDVREFLVQWHVCCLFLWLPATSYRLPATSYQLPATGYRLPATS